MSYLQSKKKSLIIAGTKKKLPASFQEVEYIQSTQLQYIDTDYRINENFLYKIKFAITDTRTSTNVWPVLMGAYGLTNASDGKDYVIGYTPSRSVVMGKAYTINQINTMEFSRNVFAFNDYKKNRVPPAPWNGEPYGPVYIFNRIASDYPPFAGVQAIAKVYYAKIYDGNTLKRNLIPCYALEAVTNAKGTLCSVGTIGMYDTVGKKFYTNSGTGTFLKGNDVI